MIWAVRSSGRQSTSEPFIARPIGVLAVATMTASGIDHSYEAGTVGGSVRPFWGATDWHSGPCPPNVGLAQRWNPAQCLTSKGPE